jgi:hypothetical protein
MWQKIVLDDIDHDGDIDILAGNLGLNTQLRASQKEPMTLTYGDFDQNGTIEPVINYFIQGKAILWRLWMNFRTRCQVSKRNS